MDIRPIRPTSDALVAADDVYYQEAARAITDRDYGRALDYLQAARDMQADDVRVLNGFGVVYDKLGRFDLSARYYAQALAVSPHSTIVLKNVAYSQVLQRMGNGQVTSTMSAAVLPPSPTSQSARNDLPPDQAPAERPQEPQILPRTPPVTVVAAPPSPALLTAASFQMPDLALAVAPADRTQEPEMLQWKPPVAVMAAPLSPAGLTAANFQMPDLTLDLAFVERPQESQILPWTLPVAVVAAPLSPAGLTAASFQMPDMTLDLALVERPQESQILPWTPPVTVEAAPLSPAGLTAASFQMPDLTLDLALVERPQESQILPWTLPVTVVAAPPSPVLLTAASFQMQDLAPAMVPPDRPQAPQMVPKAIPVMLEASPPPPTSLTAASFKLPDLAPAALSLQKSQPAVHAAQVPIRRGRHLAVVNATGQSGVSEPVRQHLLHLGWTAPQWATAEAASQSDTTIRFGQSDSFIAHALARTLPFRVHLAMCVDRCNGLALIVGSNYLGWKPKPSLARRWG